MAHLNQVDIAAKNNVARLNADEALCGIGSLSFPFLQKFASKKTYVIVYGLIGSFYLALSTYFVGTISTLEKRFQIPSFYIGLINSACDVGVIFTTLTASYLGKSSHKTRWVACGTALVGLSCFVRLIPHWLYGPGENALQLTQEFSTQHFLNNGSDKTAAEKIFLCGGVHDDVEDCEKSQTGNIAAFIFLIAHMMQGIGSSVYYTLGIAYLDDNARKTKVPMLLAISQCLRMIGPTFGYMFASYAVGIFIEPNKTPLISDVDPRWVGAWWLGWGPMGGLCLVLSLCMAMFPKTLPRTAQRNLRTDVVEQQHFVEQQEIPKLSLHDFKNTVARLLKNKVLVCNSISSICFTFGFLGQWIFLPKYMETQFHKSASNVSFISGAFGLLFTAAGILVSAAVISKYQPSARKLAGWNILTEVLDCISFVAILFVGCGNRSFQGINPSSLELINDCNSDCHCPENTPFSPICQAQQSFFSPCHAGCSSVNSTFGAKIFENCSCAQGSEPAVDGLCPIDCAQAFAIFVIIHCIQRFFGATGRAGNTLIHFRCVSPEDKPVSVGLLEFCLCAFAFIPAPLIYGHLIDRACLIWGENCGEQGNCWVYDVDKLRFYVNLPILGCIVLGTLWDIGVWYNVGQLPMYDEEDDKQNVSVAKVQSDSVE